MFKVFDRPALVRDSFRVIEYDGVQYGYSFKFNTTDTRGAYLSLFYDFTVKLDGKDVDPYDMTIIVDGREYTVARMPELTETVIDLGKEAEIKVRDYSDLSGKHTLTLSYKSKLSFIFVAGHNVYSPMVDEMEVEV